MKKHTLLTALLLMQVLVYGRKDGSPALQAQSLSFQENKGQVRDQKGNPRTDIDFVLKAPGMTLYIGNGQLHYQFIKEQARDTTTYTKANPPKHYQVAGGLTVSRLDLSLEGANKDAAFSKEEPRKAKYQYYTDADPDGVTGVQAYGKIIYKNIYPSIDWVLYTNGKSLKYDFIVHPGGKVSDIQMKYEGAESMQLQKDGSLKVSGRLGTLTEEAPYSYEQESKQAVSGKFLLDKNTLSYQVAPHKGTLVIDPGVEWGTYFGGEEAEGANSVTVDAAGNAYICGATNSLLNIATTGAQQTTFSGANQDAFLAKFDSLGQLQWATYYGGTATTGFYITTQAMAVAADPFGHVYIAGITSAENGIGTTGSFQPNRATNAFFQGFLAQFNSEGVRQWGTYYGTSLTQGAFLQNSTMIYAVACDHLGNVYIGGQTDSLSSTTGTLVTAGAHQTVYGGEASDGLLVKFDSSGSRQWATYYGGEDHDGIFSVTCDDSNNVYLSGPTVSHEGIVTPGTLEDAFHSDVQGYVAKLNSDGVRQWGTYIHAGWARASIAVDPFNHVYFAGASQSAATDTFIYTPGCHQSTLALGSQYNGCLIQLNTSDGTRNWGTYYGAEGVTYGSSVACDELGNVFLSGSTKSYAALTTETIATVGSHQDTLGSLPGLNNPPTDAFVVQFDSTGKRKWASYYGGSGDDDGRVACGPTNALYLAGGAASATAIATTGAYQTTLGGSDDAFLVRWLPIDIALNAVVSPENDTTCAGAVPFSVWVKNQGRMDKEDTLKISYSFSGPSTGSLDTFFAGGLAAGAEDTFGLGDLDMSFPGNYEVTVYLHYIRDDNERDNDTIHLSLTATNAQPVADINVSQVGTVFHFSNANAQPSDSYHWDFGDGNTSTDANPTHEYSVTDSYLVTLIVTGFCGSDTATVMVAGIGDPEGISNPALAGKLSIYPNPATQALYLKADADLQLESYTIINALGRQLQSGTLRDKNSINVSNLASGSYFIRIQTAKGVVGKQFQLLNR
jgi:hypothetical protein